MAYVKYDWNDYTWEKGQQHFQDQLNHMEDGIATAGGGTPVIQCIELSGATGVLTEEQVKILNESELNYIWYDSTYRLDYRQKDGIYTIYSFSAGEETRSIKITIATKEWTYIYSKLQQVIPNYVKSAVLDGGGAKLIFNNGGSTESQNTRDDISDFDRIFHLNNEEPEPAREFEPVKGEDDSTHTYWTKITIGEDERAVGSGTTDYDLLNNKPKINNQVLSGEKTSHDLGLQDELPSGSNDTFLHKNKDSGNIEWVEAPIPDEYIKNATVSDDKLELTLTEVTSTGSSEEKFKPITGVPDDTNNNWKKLKIGDDTKNVSIVSGTHEGSTVWKKIKIDGVEKDIPQDKLPEVTESNKDRYLHTDASTGELEWKQVKYEDTDNKKTAIDDDTKASDTYYPTTKAVFDYAEYKNNRSNAFDSDKESTSKYYNAKVVYDEIDKVRKIAAGKTASYSVSTANNPAFATQDDSFTITSLITTAGVEVQYSSLKIGDNIFVIETNYPDRWVSAVGTSDATCNKLETMQAPVTSVNTKTGDIVLNSDDIADTDCTNKFVTDADKNNWNGKVDANTAITGATKCKIQYDSKGLVLSGADLDAADIPNLTLTKITDVSASATEVNYTKGVTSGIQDQLNDKQPKLPEYSTHADKFLKVKTGGSELEWATITGVPTLPTTDGKYRLVCEVTGGVPSMLWVIDTDWSLTGDELTITNP